MPEIKHNFTGGKMNKDVDERLVPNGEYRDAMNIQVSTSEGSDVGTVQNILGNIPGCQYPNAYTITNPIQGGSTTVGSISDEKNDSLYWFVSGPSDMDPYLPLLPNGAGNYTSVSFKDMIMHHDVRDHGTLKHPILSGPLSGGDNCRAIFVDKYAFITHNDDFGVQNHIVLSDTSLYPNITTGMTVTGYNSGGITFDPVLVTGVGNLNTIPLGYSFNSLSIGSSQAAPVDYHDMEVNLRTFDNHGTCGFCSGHVYNKLAPPSSTCCSWQYDLPPVGIHQFWIDAGDWDNTINVGSVMTQVLDHNTGGNILNGQPSATITDIKYSFVCNDLQTSASSASGCQQAYLLTIDANPLWEGSLPDNVTPYGSPTFQGESLSYKGFDAIITPAPVTTYSPSNTVNISPQDLDIIDDIYNALQGGATLYMNPNSNWPAGGCIDPASVTSVIDTTFDIVDCGDLASGTITPIMPYSILNWSLSFDVVGGVIPQAVWLHEYINSSNSNPNGATDTLLFQSKKVLNFEPDRPITGINIIDDMLFWTDNFTEPKKINITRSIQGTIPNGETHTKLINEAQSILPHQTVVPIREEHITVIKKSPKAPLTLDLLTGRIGSKNYSGIITVGLVGHSFITSNIHDFSTLTVGDTFRTKIESDMVGNTSFSVAWKVGSKVVLKEFFENGNPPQLSISDYRIKGTIKAWGSNNVNSSYDNTTGGDVQVSIEITSIEGYPPNALLNSTLNYAIDLFDDVEKLFEFKFPRFSYRYKYEDGEYSTFAPFTEVAFVPGSFNYHPEKGYNLGMTNRTKSIILKNFVTNDIPKDVTEIDLLYKEDISPNIYIVDTIKPKDIVQVGDYLNKWGSNTYEIESETLKAVVSENQLLRPWDNVPRKALAQDVTGNRIVYGNYLQNYDLTILGDDFTPSFKHSIISESVIGTVTSIKSLRDYQLGVVFIDEYGRETPVLSNPTATFKVEKSQANKENKLRVGLRGLPPSWVNSTQSGDFKYYKFFIKETSGEYYNLAMDRYYDAGDGNYWVSFPSSDRNKVDIDTFLILKKGVDSSVLVQDKARYKIIAIENEAPDYIKTKKHIVYFRTHNNAANNDQSDDLFNSQIPEEGSRIFQLNYDEGVFNNSSINMLHEDMGDGVLYFQLQDADGVGTKRYKINGIGLLDATTWAVTLDENFESDINRFTNDDQGVNSTEIESGNKVVIYRDTVENSPEFDGRFFIKIYRDEVFEEIIVETSEATTISESYYGELYSKKIYCWRDGSGQGSAHEHAWAGGNPPASNSNIEEYAIGALSSYATLTWLEYYTITCRIGHDFGDTDSNWTWNHGNGSGWINADAFFRGINIAKASSGQSNINNHGISYRIPEQRIDENLHDFKFQDVWFVNAGHTAGQHDFNQGWAIRTDNDGFHWPKKHGENWDGIAQDGSNSTISLGFGGIQPPNPWKTTDGEGTVGTDGANDIVTVTDPSVFDLLDNNGYADEHDFIKAIEGTNTIIRWKEDPTKTLYTILSTAGFKNAVYEPHQHGWKDQKVPMLGVYRSGPDNEGNDNEVYATSTFFRPSNNIRTWTCTLDKDMTASTVWNPYVDGKIDNGLQIQLVANGTTAAGVNEIVVDSLVGADVNAAYGDQTLQVGMVLHSVDGDVQTTISTSYNPLDDLVMVSTIDTDTNAIRFKKFFPAISTSSNPVDLTTPAITDNHVLVFAQYGFNCLSPNSAKNINYFNDAEGFSQPKGVDAVGYTLQILEPRILESELPTDPAIWETEPKEDKDLDIYYEISGSNPIILNQSTTKTVLPVGSSVKTAYNRGGGTDGLRIKYNNISPAGDVIWLNEWLCVNPLGCGTTDPIEVGDLLYVTRLDGTTLTFTVQEIMGMPSSYTGPQAPTGTAKLFRVNSFLYSGSYTLNWHNCYSFGNGVESNRIRDNFNLPFILNGVKASTTLDSGYKQEHRKHGLIYSGIYNSNSGINNLNQFIQAEKITKDINPTYGSIQKLYSRATADGDLIALCEDRILKILANKDAVYNADGNTQLTATNKVLGQAIPYSGNFGISKNPESFASESYRIYFTDKVRGAIVRLSKDGLTPISDHGMKDWFRDNLKLSTKLIGSYDDKKDEYNITLQDISKTVSFREDVKGWVSFKSFIPEMGGSCANQYFTFYNGGLWRHHYDPAPGDYFYLNRNTFYNGSGSAPSSLTVLLNDLPGSIKSFTTLNYEGSQSKVDIPLDENLNVFRGDGDYYNITPKVGWNVSSIKTDQEKGSLNEFIKKENKWFNYIRGQNIATTILSPVNNAASPSSSLITINTDGSSSFDQSSFAIQGIGTYNSITTANYPGCTDSLMFNYDSNASIDDGSCYPFVWGCTDPTAQNYITPTGNNLVDVNSDDGSCIICGCTDPLAFNYNSLATSLCGGGIYACTTIVPGCTDNTAYNYDCISGNTPPCNDGVNTDDGSCVPYIYGCMQKSADNSSWNGTVYTANTEDQSCEWRTCGGSVYPNNWTMAPGYTLWSDTSATAPVSGELLQLNDGSSVLNYDYGTNPYPFYNMIAYCGGTPGCAYGPPGSYPVGDQTWWDSSPYGPLDQNLPLETISAYNYDALVTWDDGSCIFTLIGCTDTLAFNYNSSANIDDGSCVYTGCTDQNASNYLNDPSIQIDDGSCVYEGCMDPAATNYDMYAQVADPNAPCLYIGCTDNMADNFDFAADATHADDGSCIYPGCTDPNAFNYGYYGALGGSTLLTWNVQAHLDPWLSGTAWDASLYTVNPYPTCDYVGCMDATANNYNSSATIPCDGTNSLEPCFASQASNPDGCCCDYEGCMDPAASNYDVNATTNVNCIYDGCTDPTACNYDPGATLGNPTASSDCDFTTCVGCATANANNFGYQDPGPNPSDPCLLNGPGSIPAPCTVACASCCTFTFPGCMDPNTCNYDANATIDDGSCCSTLHPSITGNAPNNGCGCGDVSAINFNPNIDPASACSCCCTYFVQPDGCTDPTACNYDALAPNDDGSCLYGFDDISFDMEYEATGALLDSVLNSEVAQDEQYLGTNFPLIRFSFTASPSSNYDWSVASNVVRMDIYKKNDANTTFGGTPVYTQDFNGAFYTSLQIPNQGINWAFATGTPPVQGPNNYEFQVYNQPQGPGSNPPVLREYLINLYSVIDFVPIGAPGTSTAACGFTQVFTMDIIGCMADTPAFLGCHWDTSINPQNLGACNLGCEPGVWPVAPYTACTALAGQNLVTCDDGVTCDIGNSGYDCIDYTDASGTTWACEVHPCGSTLAPQFVDDQFGNASWNCSNATSINNVFPTMPNNNPCYTPGGPPPGPTG